MRASTPVAAGAMLLLWTLTVPAITPTPADHRPPEAAQKTAAGTTSTRPDPIHVDSGGDAIASATPIPGFPYSDDGTTCAFVDDYGPTCGFAGGAPDVVYRHTATASMVVSMNLCGSDYDTELYVFEDSAANQIACNDDACGLQSSLPSVFLSAGHTYYIVVDGYSSACGHYALDISDCCGCQVPCPTGGLAEGEPICQDDYVDSYNAGCQSNPIAFTDLPCTAPGAALTVCGTYGGFLNGGLSYRDTDWYQIELTDAATITWCVTGEYDTLCGIIDGREGCPVEAFLDYTSGGGCMPLCVTDTLPPGTWWLWVGTAGFGPSAGPCGGRYVATLSGHDCGPPTAVEPATWGGIKGAYR